MIPGGLTSLLQLLDVCTNRPFKVILREKYTSLMADGKHEYVPTGENRWPDTDLLYTWIKDAWERISL